MPRTLSANLTAAKNAVHSTSPWLVLLDVLMPDSVHFRLVNNNEDISFGGNTYTKANFSLEPPRQLPLGEIPYIKLQVSNFAQSLMEEIEKYSGGVGATATIVVVNAGLLSENYTDLTMAFDAVGCAVDAHWVTFTLGAPNPLLQRFPLFRYIALRCSWHKFYKGAECAYSGGLSTCDGTYEDCQRHSNTVRFGGYLGLSGRGIKVV